MSYGYDYDSDSNSNSLLKIMMEEEDKKKKKRKMIVLTAAFLSTIPVTLDKRDSSFFRLRLKWDAHVTKLNREGPNAFYSMYRMHYPSYMKLCSLIEDAVRKNFDTVNSKADSPITTPIALHCCLRWLSGGSHHDIRVIAGISKAAFYHYAHRCIDAIIHCDELSFTFPKTPLEIERAALGFKAISLNGIMDGCVAAMDGILIKIKTPSTSEVGNVKAFFSGHYHAYGVNVQVLL